MAVGDVEVVDLVAPGDSEDHCARSRQQHEEGDDPAQSEIGEQCGESTDKSRARQGQQPRHGHFASNAPANLGACAADTRTKDPAGADMGGREAEAEVCRGQDGRGRGRT